MLPYYAVPICALLVANPKFCTGKANISYLEIALNFTGAQSVYHKDSVLFRQNRCPRRVNSNFLCYILELAKKSFSLMHGISAWHQPPLLCKNKTRFYVRTIRRPFSVGNSSVCRLPHLDFAMSYSCVLRRSLPIFPPYSIRKASCLPCSKLQTVVSSPLLKKSSGSSTTLRCPEFVASLIVQSSAPLLETCLTKVQAYTEATSRIFSTAFSSSLSCHRLPEVKGIKDSKKTMHYSSSASAQPFPSLFAGLEKAPPDPVLGLQTAYKACTAKEKVDLGVGAYRTDEGKPYVFECVRKVENQLAADTTLTKEYLPIDGLPELKRASQELIFGEDSRAVREHRVCSVQSLSGTGALRVAAEFIRTFISSSSAVYMSDPTWANHPNVFKKAGLEVATYPYWDAATRQVDFSGMVKTLEAAAPLSVVLLHTCAHNPTGVDLNQSQWRQLLKICQRGRLIPILDTAYQGYATGDLKRDRFSVELFCNEGNLEMFVCQSFAKNMGLYGERAGVLHIVCATAERADVVLSQVKKVIRPMYSNPPLHAALIASRILTDPTLRVEWEAELKKVAGRIQSVRADLRSALERKGTPGTWKHITDQIGMFSYTGLTPDQCDRLTNQWHIFLMRNGRISLAGLNRSNVDYVANAIDDVVRALPSSTSRI